MDRQTEGHMDNARNNVYRGIKMARMALRNVPATLTTVAEKLYTLCHIAQTVLINTLRMR